MIVETNDEKDKEERILKRKNTVLNIKLNIFEDVFHSKDTLILKLVFLKVNLYKYNKSAKYLRTRVTI